MSEFPPYRYRNCVIYTPRNGEFLRLFVDRLQQLSNSEKEKANGRIIHFGGVKYQFLYQNGKVYLGQVTKRTRGKIFLAEE